MPRTVLLGLCLITVASVADAAPRRYTLARVLSAPAPGAHGYFGFALASHGDRLLVSALLPEWASGGEVYLVDPGTGAVERIFSAPAGGASSFGLSIASVNGTVVVGAPAQTGGTPPAGAAYVFDATTGILLRTLTNPVPGSEFGYAVARLGDDVLVSARGSGPVHLFDGATGALLQTFPNPGLPYDNFGASIAAVGPNVVVGAPSAVGFYTGRAYLFDGASGALLRIFENPTSDGDDGFGQVVGTLDGDVLVGDPYDSTDLPSAGQVHRFDPASGQLLRTYHAPGGALGTFGYGAVADVDGDLLAGAPADRSSGAITGAAYLLDGTTGTLRTRFLPSIAVGGDLTGYTVATVGTYVAVSAAYADTPAENEGRLYLFEPCGSGVVDGNEECDDGNTVDGDGCSSLCFVEPCTPTPPAGCHAPGAPGAAALVLKDGSVDSLVWKWRRGATTLAELGNPTSTSHHALCVWDGSAVAQPRLVRSLAAGEACGTKPCWREKPGKGFVFADTKAVGGVSNVTLAAGAGSARVGVKGKGAPLGLPALPLTPPVTAQLHNVETGACWTAVFTNPSRNEPGRFTARSD